MISLRFGKFTTCHILADFSENVDMCCGFICYAQCDDEEAETDAERTASLESREAPRPQDEPPQPKPRKKKKVIKKTGNWLLSDCRL